jgi:hypothetical protein
MTIKIIGLYSPAPGSGKSTIATYLEDYDYSVVPFAGFLKGMVRALLVELGYTPARTTEMIRQKDLIVPGINIRMRTLMQTLGTEWGRNTLDQDFWINCWKEKVKSYRSLVVADDVRFPNEALAIKEMGGEVWKIVRPGTENNENHSSEGQLDHWDGFSRIIVNGGSIDDLYHKLNLIMGDAEGKG